MLIVQLACQIFWCTGWRIIIVICPFTNVVFPSLKYIISSKNNPSFVLQRAICHKGVKQSSRSVCRSGVSQKLKCLVSDFTDSCLRDAPILINSRLVVHHYSQNTVEVVYCKRVQLVPPCTDRRCTYGCTSSDWAGNTAEARGCGGGTEAMVAAHKIQHDEQPGEQLLWAICLFSPIVEVGEKGWFYLVWPRIWPRRSGDLSPWLTSNGRDWAARGLGRGWQLGVVQRQHRWWSLCSLLVPKAGRISSARFSKD